MLTRLQISLGGGHTTLALDLGKGRPMTGSRGLGRVSLLLVAPIVLLLVAQAVGSLSGWYSLDRLLNAPGAPWVDLLAGASLACVVALALVVAARLRMAASRGDGSWRLVVTLCVTPLEAVVVAIAAVLLVLFVVHLVADGLACARGVRDAC